MRTKVRNKMMNVSTYLINIIKSLLRVKKVTKKRSNTFKEYIQLRHSRRNLVSPLSADWRSPKVAADWKDKGRYNYTFAIVAADWKDKGRYNYTFAIVRHRTKCICENSEIYSFWVPLSFVV